jgi:hypothetical protein
MNKRTSASLTVIGGLTVGAVLAFLIQFAIYGAPAKSEPPAIKYGNFDHLLEAVSAKTPVVVVCKRRADCALVIAWFQRERIAVNLMDPAEFDARANGRTGKVSPLRAELFPIVFASDRVVSGFRPEHYAPLRRHASQ